MDRSLDESIAERQVRRPFLHNIKLALLTAFQRGQPRSEPRSRRAPPPPRRRENNYPRDGVRKVTGNRPCNPIPAV